MIQVRVRASGNAGAAARRGFSPISALAFAVIQLNYRTYL
jgi:hypothetical protein